MIEQSRKCSSHCSNATSISFSHQDKKGSDVLQTCYRRGGEEVTIDELTQRAICIKQFRTHSPWSISEVLQDLEQLCSFRRLSTYSDYQYSRKFVESNQNWPSNSTQHSNRDCRFHQTCFVRSSQNRTSEFMLSLNFLWHSQPRFSKVTLPHDFISKFTRSLFVAEGGISHILYEKYSWLRICPECAFQSDASDRPKWWSIIDYPSILWIADLFGHAVSFVDYFNGWLFECSIIGRGTSLGKSPIFSRQVQIAVYFLGILGRFLLGFLFNCRLFTLFSLFSGGWNPWRCSSIWFARTLTFSALSTRAIWRLVSPKSSILWEFPLQRKDLPLWYCHRKMTMAAQRPI
jgi:hypothetical protein